VTIEDQEMKAFQINIYSATETRCSSELSCVIKAKSLKEAKEVAKEIIDENIGKFETVKLESVKRI